MYFIAFIITLSQYYGYALFSICAVALAQEYISDGDLTSKLTSFFLILASAVLVKPLASIIFGTIGDYLGRAKALKFSSISATIAMFILAFVPGHSNIGVYGVFLLLFSRILILISVTGQSDGIRIYITEHISKTKINFANGLISTCAQFGVLLAALIMFLLSKYNFSYKFAFLIGGILGTLTIYLRKSLIETKEFQERKNNINIFAYLRENYKLMLIAILIQGSLGGMYHFYIIFSVSYLKILSAKGIIGIVNPYLISAVSIGTYAIFSPLAGYLADKYKFIPAYSGIILSFGLCVSSIVFSIYQYSVLYIISIILQAALIPFYSVAMPIYIRKKLPVSVRYRVFSFTHSIGSVVISSPTPLIANIIWQKTSLQWLNTIYPAVLLTLLFCALTYICRDKEEYS